jgi:hypothetical protein
MTTNDYIKLLKAEGFIKILEEEFVGNDNCKEIFFIYFHKNGIFVSFDTYSIHTINAAKMVFNWKPKTLSAINEICGSGYFIKMRNGKMVWIGSDDVRDSMWYKLRRLRRSGVFIRDWFECPDIWWVNYTESKLSTKELYLAMIRKFCKLPQSIQQDFHLIHEYLEYGAS